MKNLLSLLMCLGFLSPTAIFAQTITPTAITAAKLPESPEPTDISSLALALLSTSDIQSVLPSAKVRPNMAFINTHWFRDGEFPYETSTDKNWYEGNWPRVGNEIYIFSSSNEAQTHLMDLTTARKEIPFGDTVGDKTLRFYQDATSDTPDSVVTVFSVGRYASVVQLYRNNSNTNTTQGKVAKDLQPLATRLAKLQEEKFKKAQMGLIRWQASGSTDFPYPPTLPQTRPAGEVPLTALEWRTRENEYQNTAIQGFQKARMRFYQLQDIPYESLDVGLFLFDSPESAKKFKDELARRQLPKIDLPDNLKTVAVGAELTDVHKQELRLQTGKWVADILVVAPFQPIDVENSRSFLLMIGQKMFEEMKRRGL